MVLNRKGILFLEYDLTNQVRTGGDYVNYTYDPIGKLQSALGFLSKELVETGAWNVTVRCRGALTLDSESIGSFERERTEMSVQIGSTELMVVGDLPSSKTPGSGNLLLKSQSFGSFKSDRPRDKWVFYDQNGRPFISIDVLNIFDKAKRWNVVKMGLIEKIGYLFSGGLELRYDSCKFLSPKFVITSRPLLSDSEQQMLEANVPFGDQLWIGVAILLVQTTFGREFVT